jgi:2-haloacid dehalogenase
MTSLKGIQACVFDAYGTLFDVHSAAAQHSTRLVDATAVSTLWRTKQIEYTWLRTLMGRYVEFWQITGDALDFALETHQVSDSSLREDLMQAYLELSCYPDVPLALKALCQRGIRCAILSNGSPAMLAAAVENAELVDRFSAVISVDPIQIYKPDPRVYQMAVDELQLQPAQIAFQSSNAWDAVGATAFGFQVVWVNRFGQQPERLGVQGATELKSLEGLPELIGD